MSNKTRLQTNNTNLQALIDKANTLPDAETCTVTIIKSDRNATTEFYYTNENGEFCTAAFELLPATQTASYSIIKNTIVCFSYLSTVNIAESGLVTKLGERCYGVYGDATFTLSNSAPA